MKGIEETVQNKQNKQDKQNKQNESVIELEKISMSFDGEVLCNISMHVDRGETVALLGASGIGKTTLFNILAGVLAPQSGRINITGAISYMQQHDLLQRFLTVEDNVCLPLRVKGYRRSQARKLAIEQFPRFGLEGTQGLYPQQLSGGMRQRAAFLRTYLQQGDIMLLDEPFCALDTITKRELYRWFSGVLKQFGLTMLFITHDIDEAILLADRVYVLGNTETQHSNEASGGLREVVIESQREGSQSGSPLFLKYRQEIEKILDEETDI